MRQLKKRYLLLLYFIRGMRQTFVLSFIHMVEQTVGESLAG